MLYEVSDHAVGNRTCLPTQIAQINFNPLFPLGNLTLREAAMTKTCRTAERAPIRVFMPCI